MLISKQSVWSANIFTMDPEKSWKIYLATGLSSTVMVFTIWFIYISVSRRQAQKIALSNLNDLNIEKDFGIQP
jgi:hypothetical protein